MPEETKPDLGIGHGALPGANDTGEPTVTGQNNDTSEPRSNVPEPGLQTAVGPVEEFTGETESHLDDLAQEVMAVLDAESPPLKVQTPSLDDSKMQTGDAPDAPASELSDTGDITDDVFFAGWDGLDDPYEEQPEPEAPARETPDVPRRAAGEALPSLENPVLSGADSDLPDKHDALAEAVQSALLSVYGSGKTPSTFAGPDRPGEPETAGIVGDKIKGRPEPSLRGLPSLDDGLSPQDVILGFFNYKAGAKDGTAPSDISSFEDDEDDGDASFIAKFSSSRASKPEVRAFNEPALFRSPAHREPSAALRTEVSYDGPAAFPVPVSTAPAPEVAERGADSGRLLGVAGIGLIGGIAIAAALAVFMLGSYEPEQQKATAPDASQTAALAPVTLPSLLERSGEVSASDITAPAGQALALDLSVKSSRPLDQTLVSITGIPRGARLSAGVDAGNGNWLLPPQRLAGLMLSLPEGSRDGFSLEAQLIDSNAKAVLSATKKFAVILNNAVGPVEPSSIAPSVTVPNVFALQTDPPRAAPSPGAFTTQAAISSSPPPSTPFKTQIVPPVAAETPVVSSLGSPSAAQLGTTGPGNQQGKPNRQPEIEDLIREGNKRMREGDIMQARDLYLKAINLGDAEAALAMGRSYDPIYFDRLDKKNAEADAAKAFEWYRKAMDAGASQTARVRIDNLKRYLNE